MNRCCPRGGDGYEMQETRSHEKYKIERFSSPLLCGKSIGAQINRILTNNSLALLIVWGNIKLETNINMNHVACLISTNQIHQHHDNLTDYYRKRYEQWMDRAVSDLIFQIDSITSPCILFSNSDSSDKLFIDLTLSGKTHGKDSLEKKARISVNQTLKNENHDVYLFELFIDTVVHDNGVW